jgi:hypothetical protein
MEKSWIMPSLLALKQQEEDSTDSELDIEIIPDSIEIISISSEPIVFDESVITDNALLSTSTESSELSLSDVSTLSSSELSDDELTTDDEDNDVNELSDIVNVSQPTVMDQSEPERVNITTEPVIESSSDENNDNELSSSEEEDEEKKNNDIKALFRRRSHFINIRGKRK